MQKKTESELQAELELALLQINQLQEECEQYYIGYNELKESGYDAHGLNINSLNKSTDDIHEEHQSLLLLRKTRCNDIQYLKSSSFTYKEKLENESLELKRTVTALTEENKQLKNNSEQQTIQIAKINEELRTKEGLTSQTLSKYNKVVNQKFDADNHLKAKETDLHALEAEKELSLLQIQQLQEELEIKNTGYQIIEAELAEVKNSNIGLFDSNKQLNDSIIELNDSAEQEIRKLRGQTEKNIKSKREVEDALVVIEEQKTKLVESNKDLHIILEDLNKIFDNSDEDLIQNLSRLKVDYKTLVEVKQSLATELADTKNQLTESEKDNIASKACIEKLTESQTALEQEIAELTDECAQQNNQLTAAHNQLSDSELKYNALVEDKQNLTTELADTKNQLTESEKDKQTSKVHIEQLTQSKVTLEQEITELTKQRDDESHWHQKHKKWAESLKGNVSNLEIQLAEKSRDISLGQKILAKSQIDLEHLRESYAEKQANEKELVELVNELREKLTLASKYYFELQQEHPELLTSLEQADDN